jgi:hypothetical protein
MAKPASDIGFRSFIKSYFNKPKKSEICARTQDFQNRFYLRAEIFKLEKSLESKDVNKLALL